MPSPSNNFKPFMAYLTPPDIARLKRFAKNHKQPMAQIVREAISARLTEGNLFVEGFNSGVNKSIDLINNMNHAQMRFPSGRSFAELVSDELVGLIMVSETNNET
jgi:hypothetical protein